MRFETLKQKDTGIWDILTHMDAREDYTYYMRNGKKRKHGMYRRFNAEGKVEYKASFKHGVQWENAIIS